jgi:ribosomal protein L11 methyltransferase
VPEQEKFDVILANINKNVILANLPLLYQRLKTNGILLLSGLLAEDEKDMLEAIDKLKLKFINKTVRSNWLSLRLSS